MIPRPRSNPLGFPPARAVEHAAFQLRAAPESVHQLLLPVWRVEVEARVTTAEPYQLVDRYLSRGVEEAGLTTPDELATFLALDPALTRQALAYLRAVGHLTEDRGRLTLTDLGRRSLADGEMYTVKLGDRRVVYFDAWTGTPLAEGHAEKGPAGPAPLDTWTSPPPLLAPDPFRPEAAHALAEPGVADPKALTWDVEYLLAHVVRTGDARHLVCTRPRRGEPDPVLSRALDRSPACLSALADAGRRARKAFEEEAGRWLSRRGLAAHPPHRDPDGMHRVRLAEDDFTGAGPAGDGLTGDLPALGSVVVLRSGGFFQLWCADPGARRRELERRMDAFRAARPRTPEALSAQESRLASLLDVRPGQK
ncbi:hypothetical protein IAG44_06525 [Streptomyces roseirectus]|uniref:Uncharacterized protein n=1 Tax=Streptomyces roseirectus TaxID=2768066 RepID=A0A7H0I8L4_9ACTN|nr:hypothetical protein [Streptomyces roseirectus]QNP69130.1 hypothetical protein IAG44_06525 [Streptomyces roseirectus]